MAENNPRDQAEQVVPIDETQLIDCGPDEEVMARAARPAGVSAMPREKRCLHCQQLLPLDRFDEAPNYPHGYYRKDVCNDCVTAKVLEKRRHKAKARFGRQVNESIRRHHTLVYGNVRELQREAARANPNLSQFLARFLAEYRARYGRPGEEGLDVFVRFAVDGHHNARLRNPGGVVEQRYIQLGFQLMKQCQEMDKEGDLDGLTPEEVNERLKAMLSQFGRDYFLNTATREEIEYAAARLGLSLVGNERGLPHGGSEESAGGENP